MVNEKRLVVLDDGMKTYRGNWQEIKYTPKGAPYVTYNGTRLKLDDFMRTDYKHYNGAFCTSMFSSYLIELNARGDMARVTYSFC